MRFPQVGMQISRQLSLLKHIFFNTKFFTSNPLTLYRALMGQGLTLVNGIIIVDGELVIIKVWKSLSH
jgi:hypothetical protein